MREILYLPLEKRSLRYAYYMYLDVKPYLADQLFIRHKVRVSKKQQLSKLDEEANEPTDS